MSAEAQCGNCPRVTPAARLTFEWHPFAGWAVLASDGRLVAARKSQAQAWRHAESLLDKIQPEGETLVACSGCPYLHPIEKQ